MNLLSEPDRRRLSEIAEEASSWRQQIHSYPELLYDLPKTSAFVATLLRSFGCDEVICGIGGCGIVALVKGQMAGQNAIALRAEMDGLPIHEATGASYASTIPGHMHACGHDGHTATLLAAAKFLCEDRGFQGTAMFVFQPAEEGGAGAKAMLDDGILERFGPSRIFALHNRPGLAVGEFETKSGCIMSASDRFVVTVKGIGGHAALPHRANDPIVAATGVINALNAVVARFTDPLDPVVLSINAIHAGEAFNVIPDTVELKGSLRTISKRSRQECLDHLDRICSGVAATYNLRIDIDHIPLYAPTLNDPAIAGLVLDTLSQEFGPDHIRECDVMMGAEDFSYFLEALPGAYIWYGNGNSASLHNPSFDFNDRAIAHGAAAFVSLVRNAQ